MRSTSAKTPGRAAAPDGVGPGDSMSPQLSRLTLPRRTRPGRSAFIAAVCSARAWWGPTGASRCSTCGCGRRYVRRCESSSPSGPADDRELQRIDTRTVETIGYQLAEMVWAAGGRRQIPQAPGSSRPLGGDASLRASSRASRRSTSRASRNRCGHGGWSRRQLPWSRRVPRRRPPLVGPDGELARLEAGLQRAYRPGVAGSSR